MSTELVYDPKKGLGPLDRILLKGSSSGRSPKELSALVNNALSPAQCAARVLEILETRDWLSQAQKKLLLVDEMNSLKDTLAQQVHDFKDMEAVKPLISILTLLEKTLAADKFDLQKAMSEIDRAHAQLMLEGISIALERSFLELERRYPEIEKSVLLGVFHTAMPDVIKEIESRVPTDG